MLYSSKFRPRWWLRNPHIQTLWAAKVQRTPTPVTTRERLQTPDGDFLDLDWNAITDGPTVIIFHGLTGSVKSHYARSLIDYLTRQNIRTVFMHFRGCSGEPNNTQGSYHSGHTIDIATMANTIKQRFPNQAVAAAGFSLGGNALLKYLATHQNNPLSCAASVSPPLALAEGAARMNKGFSRVYQNALIKQMKDAVRKKHQRYPEFKLDRLGFEQVKNFTEFDHQITAPLHGYKSAADYYKRASTLDDLIHIQTPTHILWARDDPFFTQACIPADAQLSASVDFELSEHGGHVGFVSGIRGQNWLSERVGSLLADRLVAS